MIEAMGAQQSVYKTRVECSIGFSIQDASGNWEKSNVVIASDVGPGYPEPQLLSWVLKTQIDDATKACQEQIDNIANKIAHQITMKEYQGLA